MISIIIPVYNSQDYIKKCLKSIIHQSYSNLEIIVIDDGSSDNSYEIVKSINDSRIRLFKQNNKGVSAARNFGLSQASGDYIMFVDSDDWIEKNTCEIMINKIKEEQSDILICNYNVVTNSKKMPSFKMKKSNNVINFFINNRSWGICCKMIKRDKIIELFDEDCAVAEDLLFWIKNLKSINKYCYINEYLYNYYMRDDSIVHINYLNKKRLSELDAINKIIEDEFYNQYKYFFEMYYLDCFNKIRLLKDKDGLLSDKYKILANNYYKIIICSNISMTCKIKMFIKYRLNLIYKMCRFIKNQIKGYDY